jgi:hypothetical protein
MKNLFGMLLLIGSLFSSSAHAFCEGHNFTAKQAALTLSQINSALVKKDTKQIIRDAATLEANLPCMRTPAPPQVFAASYRYIGLGHYYRGDNSTAERWFRTALELNPSHHWGVNEISSDEEVFGIYESQRSIAKTDLVPIEGMQLLPPENTAIYIDGRLWNVASVTPDRPHIVLVASLTDRHIISRHLIDGNNMPDILMAKADPENDKKKQKTKKSDKDVSEIDQMFAVQKVKRVRPKAKTPMLISGAATMVVAGGIYSYTILTNEAFYAATTTDEKTAIRKKNNSLIILSMVVAGMGVGVEYAGIMLDTNPVMRPFSWQL